MLGLGRPASTIIPNVSGVAVDGHLLNLVAPLIGSKLMLTFLHSCPIGDRQAMDLTHRYSLPTNDGEMPGKNNALGEKAQPFIFSLPKEN